MISVIGEVIRRRAVVEVGVRHHADLLKRLEVAIDGGQGQGRPTISSDGCGESIGRGVTEPTDRIDDSLPLPGQAHATGPQPFAKVLHTAEPTLTLEVGQAGSTDLASSL